MRELCRKKDAHSLRVLAVLFGGATLKAIRFIVLVIEAIDRDPTTEVALGVLPVQPATIPGYANLEQDDFGPATDKWYLPRAEAVLILMVQPAALKLEEGGTASRIALSPRR